MADTNLRATLQAPPTFSSGNPVFDATVSLRIAHPHWSRDAEDIHARLLKLAALEPGGFKTPLEAK